MVVPDESAPTVLLITSDTHRADHVGFAAEGVSIATPVIDALAERGVVFEDCFAPVNVTNPSHVALMTARSLRTTGVRTNFSRLSDAAPTLAEAFSDAGWMTMAAVSTRHLGADGSGLGQGFDSMSWPRANPRRRAEDTLADVIRWLPAAEGRPLFLWLHVFDAHWPYEPESDWVDHYYPSGRDPRDPSLPELAVDPGRFKSELKGLRDLDWPRAQYKAEISGQDALLDDLLKRPRFREGVVAFVSDHGESLGEHGVFFDHVGLYPSVLHIPLVLAGPGVPVGKRSERPVMHTDLGRTLLDLAGLQDVPFPGTDLLSSKSIEPRFGIEGYGLSASMTHNGLHLVLNLSAREIESALQRAEHHEVEIYDLTDDPSCRNNLIDDRFEIAEAMRARLVEWLEEVPDRGWAEQREDDAAFLESLKQLGYVEPTQNVSAHLWQPDECAWCQRFGG
jgi:arylsulfatase A-like enzyme